MSFMQPLAILKLFHALLLLSTLRWRAIPCEQLDNLAYLESSFMSYEGQHGGSGVSCEGTVVP